MALPDNLEEILETVPWVEFEEAMTDDQKRIYEIGKDRHCMACGSELGEHTYIIIAPPGIIGVYCCGACLTDMTNIGFLEQRRDEILRRLGNRAQESTQGGDGGEGEAPQSGDKSKNEGNEGAGSRPPAGEETVQ